MSEEQVTWVSKTGVVMSGNYWYKRFLEELEGEIFPFAKQSDREVRELVEKCKSAAYRASIPHPPHPKERGKMMTELRKIMFALLEQGNLYDGYVASAEFNAFAIKKLEEYEPKITALINQQVRETVEKVNKIYEANYFATLTNEEMMKRLSELNQLEEKS